MNFRVIFNDKFVSDNLQHFSKFDLFDLCDLYINLKVNITIMEIHIFFWAITSI